MFFTFKSNKYIFLFRLIPINTNKIEDEKSHPNPVQIIIINMNMVTFILAKSLSIN